MEVKDLISAVLQQKGSRVWSVPPDATVYDALLMMAQNEIGALLVLESGQLIGLFSERDYARKVILHGRASKETAVSEVMLKNPSTVSLACAVSDAMKIMTETRVRHLPVIGSSGSVVGVVSIGDLVKWIITSQDETIEQLHSYISGRS